MTTIDLAHTSLNSQGVEAIAALGQAAAGPHELKPGKVYAILGADGQIQRLDLTGDPYRDRPRKLVADIHLTDPESLLAYWDKHSDSGSEVYADRNQHTITTILDAHWPSVGKDNGTDEEFRPRWTSHRAQLRLYPHPAYSAWVHHNDKLLTQVDFAEFLDDHRPYIVDPDAATLVELVQDIEGTVKASFRSGHRLANGARQIQWTEEVNAASNGKAGTLEIPGELTVALPVWRGSELAETFTARLRYRITPEGLRLGYKLNQPQDIVDAAFEAVVAQVAAHVGRPVLRGTPAGTS